MCYVGLNWHPVNVGAKMLSAGYTGWRSSQYRFFVLTDYSMFSRGCLGRWLGALRRIELASCRRGGRKGCPSGVQGRGQVNTGFLVLTGYGVFSGSCLGRRLP